MLDWSQNIVYTTKLSLETASQFGMVVCKYQAQAWIASAF